jgi:KDO2-lipid IV(A) lauroyltransferase
MSPVRAAAEAAVFGLLLRLARLVPRPAWIGLGAATGNLARILDRRHTRIAHENLRLAYGDALDRAEADRIVRECWRHFGRITFDALAFPQLSAEAAGSIVSYEGLEHVRAAYARGKGALLFTGHYGHWELSAVMQGHLGLPLALVTRPLDNPRLETMLAELRTRSGNVVVHKRRAVREIVKALGRGMGVAIVIDQDARDAGIFVPFFGRPASTTPTLAAIALRTGAAVVPSFSYPLPGGRWRVVYDPEVPVTPTGDRDADVRTLTATCTGIIERRVRERPELWLWMHRRWKTTPSPEGASETP